MLNYFEVKYYNMLNIFEFSHAKEIVNLAWFMQKNFFVNHPITFYDQDTNTKLVPASFLYFLEVMKVK